MAYVLWLLAHVEFASARVALGVVVVSHDEEVVGCYLVEEGGADKEGNCGFEGESAHVLAVGHVDAVYGHFDGLVGEDVDAYFSFYLFWQHFDSLGGEKGNLGRDAVFYVLVCGVFCLPYGYTYYRGFSMVHNYAIISLALLGFCLPFLRKITGDRIPKIYQNPIFAILIGLIFGISANFPPLAVLAAIILAKIWQLIKSRKSSKSHRVDWRVLKMEQWEGLMFGAMIAFRSFKHLR